MKNKTSIFGEKSVTENVG